MFFFSSRRRHTRLQGDWSSDVCSSDLSPEPALLDRLREAHSFDQGDGRRIWAAQVAPARVDGPRVAAHLALADLFGLPETPEGRLGGFDVETVGGARAAHPGALDPG